MKIDVTKTTHHQLWPLAILLALVACGSTKRNAGDGASETGQGATDGPAVILDMMPGQDTGRAHDGPTGQDGAAPDASVGGGAGGTSDAGGSGGAAGAGGAGGSAGMAGAAGTGGTDALGGTASFGGSAVGGVAGTSASAGMGPGTSGAAGINGSAGMSSGGSGTSAGGSGVAGAGGSAAGDGGVAGNDGSVRVGGSTGAGGGTGVGGGTGASGGAGMGGTGANGGAGMGGSAGSGAGGVSGGGAGGTGGAAVCGNGVVEPPELCDTGISSQAGTCDFSCPPLYECNVRSKTGTGPCYWSCQDQGAIQYKATDPDQCCYGAGDPDCVVGTYPARKSFQATATGTSVRCGSHNQYVSTPKPYLPIPPTSCGQPVLATVTALIPSATTSSSFYLSLGALGIGATLGGITTVPPDDPASQNQRAEESLLINMGSTDNTYVSGQVQIQACNVSSKTTAYLDVRPLAGLGVATGSPVRVRVAGDTYGSFIAFEDDPGTVASSVRLVAGQYRPFHDAANPVDASFAATGSVTLSTADLPARGVTLASQPTSPCCGTPAAPYAHAAWVEGEGSTLMYARVASDGTIDHRGVIHSGAGIDAPKIVVFDSTRLGLVWLETIDGKSQLEFTTIDLASGTPQGIVDLTHGEGDAHEPDLISAFDASHFEAGVVWVDTRSGSRELWFQRLLAGGSLGTLEQVSSAAVAPADPVLDAGSFGVRVAWTDARNGEHAVYMKDNGATSAFMARPESRVTPVGEDAQHFQLESAIANRVASSLESYRSLESATFRVVWEASGSVRLGVIKSSGKGYELVSGTRSLPLTCASAASASIARLVGDPGGNMRSNSLVAWAEAGAVQVFGFELFATPTAGIGVAGRWESQ